MGLGTSIFKAAGIGGVEKQLNNTPMGTAWTKATDTGYQSYDYGKGITEEGLGGLRSLDSTYQQSLKDPLGETGRGIFARARGGLSDAFTRDINSGQARRAQLAAQSGGTLTPEQVAALDAQDRRSAGESLFRGQNDLSQSEASMTLTETGKLFDRMEGIRKTILAVGQDEKTRGLQTMLAALTGKTNYNKAVVADILGPWGHS